MKLSLILCRYHLYSLWNWRSVYLGRLIEPLAYFVFLVAGFSGMLNSGTNIDYFTYALTGIVCLLSFRTFTSAVSDVSNDRKWGVFAIFVMQKGTIGGYIFSLFVVAAIVFLAQMLLLVVAYFIIAQPANFSDTGLTLLAGCVVATLIVWGWVGIGAAIGARIDSYSVRDLIATLTALPIVLSAPLFYRLDTAPTYLRILAHINPLTYHVSWVRSPSAWAFVFAGLWAAFGYVVAKLTLRHADRISSER